MTTAEVADLQLVAEGLGVLGIAAGGLFGALWNLEKQNGAKLQQELQDVQQQVTQLQQQLSEAQKQVQQEQKVRGIAMLMCMIPYNTLIAALAHSCQ